MKILTVAILLSIPLRAIAQQPATQEQIQRVISYAQTYREKLPSLECDEA